MEPRSAALLALLVLFAPLPTAFSQTGGLGDGDDDQAFTVVQEGEDHYILEVELPAALFKPDRETRLDIPLEGVSIDGGPQDGTYRLRVLIDPSQLGNGTMRLNDTLWGVDAQLRDALGNTTPLPSIPETDGTDLGATLDELVAQVEALTSDLDSLHEQVNQTLAQLQDGGALPPGLTPTELATTKAALQVARDELDLTRTFLNDTESWLLEPTSQLTGALEPANRSLAIAGALLNDTGNQLERGRELLPLSPGDLGDRFDQAIEQVDRLQGLVNETREDVREQARRIASQGGEQAAWAEKQLGRGGEQIETAREVLNGTIDDLLGDDEEEDEGGEDPGEGPGDPGPGQGGLPVSPPYDTVREQLLALVNLTDTGATPETSDQARDLVNDTILYLSRTDERVTWAQGWLNRSPVGPFAQAHVDKAQVVLDAAGQDIETLNATVSALLASDEEDDGEEDPEEDDGSLLEDAQAQLNATRAKLDQAIGHLDNATEAVGDVSDPQALVGERLEHPTLLRVYLPKDPTQVPEPALPTGTDALPTADDPTSDLTEDDQLPTDELPGLGGDEDGTEDGGDQDGTDDGQEDEAQDGETGDQGIGLSADPDHVAIDEDEQRVVELTVTNLGDQADTFHLTVQRDGPFQIDTNGKASLDLDPGETGSLALRVTPTGPGEGDAALIVTGDQGASSQVDLPVTVDPATEGQGQDAALWADLDPLNVRMSTDETGVVRVVIRNDGSLRDTVRLATSATGPVRADVKGAASVTLDPDQEQTLEVQLTPETDGEASVDLRLSSDRGGQLNPVLLVDILQQAAEDGLGSDQGPGTPGGAEGEPSTGEEGQAPDEEENGTPFPAVGAILATLAVVALRGRRRDV